MIVADANLLVYLLVEGPHTAAARGVLRRDRSWAAPPLWQSEFGSALLRHVRRGDFGLPEAVAMVRHAVAIIEEREWRPSATRVLALALGSGRSSYDCEYVALAEQRGVPLVTADAQVLEAFPRVAVAPEAFAAR